MEDGVFVEILLPGSYLYFSRNDNLICCKLRGVLYKCDIVLLCDVCNVLFVRPVTCN